MKTTETQIDSIIRRATEEVAATVRANLLSEIGRIVEGASPASQSESASPTEAGAGKVAKKSVGRKRDADEAEVIDFVKKHPGQRTEAICAAFGRVDRESVKRALRNARTAGFIKSDGVKRAMSWSAAK